MPALQLTVPALHPHPSASVIALGVVADPVPALHPHPSASVIARGVVADGASLVLSGPSRRVRQEEPGTIGAA